MIKILNYAQIYQNTPKKCIFTQLSHKVNTKKQVLELKDTLKLFE